LRGAVEKRRPVTSLSASLSLQESSSSNLTIRQMQDAAGRDKFKGAYEVTGIGRPHVLFTGTRFCGP
jgi:hypothetical protein